MDDNQYLTPEELDSEIDSRVGRIVDERLAQVNQNARAFKALSEIREVARQRGIPDNEAYQVAVARKMADTGNENIEEVVSSLYPASGVPATPAVTAPPVTGEINSGNLADRLHIFMDKAEATREPLPPPVTGLTRDTVEAALHTALGGDDV